jgi:hypothetical protein
MLGGGIRDLSSEIQLLGDFSVALATTCSIWLGRRSNDTQVAIKLLDPARAVASQKVNHQLSIDRLWASVVQRAP